MRGRPLPPLERARRARPEREIIRAILDALALEPGVTAWRNNTGAVTVPARGDRKARFVRFGAKGMSDIIGWRSETHVTFGAAPNVAGRHAAFARFVALEVKRPGRSATPEQADFLKRVRMAGGITGVVSSVDEALAVVRSDA